MNWSRKSGSYSSSRFAEKYHWYLNGMEFIKIPNICNFISVLASTLAHEVILDSWPGRSQLLHKCSLHTWYLDGDILSTKHTMRVPWNLCYSMCTSHMDYVALCIARMRCGVFIRATFSFLLLKERSSVKASDKPEIFLRAECREMPRLWHGGQKTACLTEQHGKRQPMMSALMKEHWVFLTRRGWIWCNNLALAAFIKPWPPSGSEERPPASDNGWKCYQLRCFSRCSRDC